MKKSPIVKNHQKGYTKECGVVCALPRGCMLNKCQKRIKMESKWWTICITSFKIYWKYRDKKLGTWKYKNQNETKATLSDLPTCYMSLYRMPSTVVNTTEKLYRNFLWKGGSLQGSHLVWWDKVIKTHAQGGLGLQSLIDKNRVLLAKWIWRYCHEDGALWKQIIDAKYKVILSKPWPNTNFPN